VAALWNVSLEVARGDFIAVFGPNGAGKSTLLRTIASLTQPDTGSVDFAGSEGGREEVGYVSHQSLLYNEMTGLENLEFYCRLYGLADPVERSNRMIEKMGLVDAVDQMVRGYSRGMKQRLTLARALLHEPRLLLLDEPYTGLDQHGSRLLTQVLRQLREDGRTVILITHNLAEGLELSTRIVIQNRGEIVYEARREEIKRDDLEKLYFGLVEG
jgi:heme exporter protein A